MSDGVWPDLMEWLFILAALVLTGCMGGALWYLYKQMREEAGNDH